MIARRLKALGSRVAAVTARVYEFVVTWPVGPRAAPRRAPISAGAMSSTAILPARSPYIMTDWLEDARRLRGRPATPAVPLRSVPAALRQVLLDPHWVSAFEAGRLATPERPARPLDERAAHDAHAADAADAARDDDPTTPHETLRALSHRPPAPSDPAPAPDATDPQGANTRGESESHRRLLLIRELVQRGLYNEGFKPGHIPEQYQPRPMPPGASTSEPPAE